MLSLAFDNAQSGSEEASMSSCWSLRGIPYVEFYRKLHKFLKKWEKTRNSTQISIGRLYISIDRQLQERGSSPSNTYKFIERIASSNLPDSSIMSYNIADVTLKSLQVEVEDYHEQVDHLASQVMKQQAELSQMKLEVEKTEQELTVTKRALKDVTNTHRVVQNERNCLQRNVDRANKLYENTLADLLQVEDDLLMRNSTLMETVSSLKKEILKPQFEIVSVKCETDENGHLGGFTFHTKEGKKSYSDTIRQLYYSLLADQIPPAKISGIIKSVLKCFLPSLNTDELELPGERCAGYMRREELRTVSIAHKAYIVAESESLSLNSDGTTKFQKKLGGVAVNGMVLCLNEVPDGSADSMIEQVSQELEKIRDIAYALNICHPEKINWTLFTSSTSDSAFTQKKFNRLVEQNRERDEEKYGPSSFEAIKLVENLCAMHLGSNLRKAFLEGIKSTCVCDEVVAGLPPQQREHNRTDTFIHEFCKLFGRQGVPEYGCGNLTFPDFLALKLSEGSNAEDRKYYESCIQVLLERQVGSRYFVSASNASKIFFLAKASIEFLEYTGKDNGNNLERTVYKKLKDPEELSRLKADALMFYFVYADLVMLAKSNDLSKSALDMNKHYLELQLFLRMVEEDPKSVMNKSYKVFPSEERLYSTKITVNHRLHSKDVPVHTRVFQPDDWDGTLLYPLLVAGATKMKQKLSEYAKNQLPGGKYWEPEPAIKAVLRNLKPNNDLCESILGLNDYLTTVIPNMHQMTRSNLVEMKKNKTMKWFQELPQKERQAVSSLAKKSRGDVMKKYREEEIARSKLRQENMRRCHERRRVMREKTAREREQLSHEHLITTVEELKRALQDIESEDITTAKKRQQKTSLIQVQINIRKKVLNQKIKIPLSQRGKQRPLTVIIKELIDFIAANPHSDKETVLGDPSFLVGQEILHRFEDESGKESWFSGIVIRYNAENNTHEVVYDGESEHCHFDLTRDIIDGDLKIVGVQ